ncbi:tetratricopeptide repeat protein [Chryseobacterium capnotolerans]|uniref:tetratricopeptide repeat protein n=1 Tax=Chryseobacterium TaxID=59732 RepID=UPI00083B65CD|nr:MULTISPECIES: tetratricopeptide repeat protein [Chryseobacterium]UHO40578.1 tetratricopeptide repeat protein [Chryseobacterium capnotolerans]
MKNFHIFILLLSSLFVQGQMNVEKQIDLLLDKSFTEFTDVQLIPALTSANEALKKSDKINYSKGKTLANIYIAKVLAETGGYNEALSYLKKAENEPYFTSYIDIQVEVCRLRGRTYGLLSMMNLSLQEFYKQLKFSQKIKDPYRKAMSTYWSHENLTEVYTQLKQYDSVWVHLQKQEDILKKMKEEQVFFDLSGTYAKKGQIYTLQKEYGKAQKYLDKSLFLLEKYKVPYLYYALRKYGDLEAARGNKDLAISYYRKALQSAAELEATDAVQQLYRVLGDYFMKNNLDPKEANQYLYQYQKLSDSLDVANKQVVEQALSQILDQKEHENKIKSRQYIYLIISVVILLLIGALFWYRWHIQNKKLIYKNKKTLSEMSQTTVELEKKIEENKFNDLLTLAKNNNPEFLILFSELYPDFIQKLKTIDPKIRSSELIFCAMAYLNFSAKDVATYTYVTLGAVEMRRSRLRKKYSIPSDIDFNNWMREY